MKLFIVALLALTSSVAMADGFRCNGRDFRVKMFNQTQPERGTKNPAVLVVYERGIGTVATLEGADIEKTVDEDAVTYEGQSNSKQDGRFVYVKLEVAKQAQEEGELAGLHLAKLSLNADGLKREASLTCERYKKSDRQ